MTTQTEFTSWQDHPKQPDPKTCSPICKSWMNHLINEWGGQNLGCYNSRPVVGGSALSSHGSGAATDWRYANPGPGRAVLLNEVLPFFVDNSRELGVQAIHDYAGSRIWRPPGCSGRPGQPSPSCGWKNQSPGPQMGQSWATWIHLECLPSRWDDGRTVEQMLHISPAPEPEPPPVIPEGVDMPLYAAKVEGEGWWLLNGVSGRKVSADDIDYVAKKMWSAKSKNPEVMQPLVDLNTGDNVRERADVSAVSMSSVKSFGG